MSEPSTTTALDHYRETMAMVRYEGQLRWNIFGLFLLAETVLLALLGGEVASLRSTELGRWMLGIAAGLGLVLCAAWGLTFFRYTSYYTLRIHQAKALEREAGCSIFTEGARFSNNQRIERLPDLPLHTAPGRIGRMFHGVVVGGLIVFVFALLFGGLLVTAFL